MKDHDITQEQVALVLDRSQGYVSHRTNGREALTVDIIGVVADLAHLTPDALNLELSQRASRALAAQAGSEPPSDTEAS